MQALLWQLSCLQGIQIFLSDDLKRHLTSTNFNRIIVCTKGNLHTRYEMQARYTLKVIMFTVFTNFNLY